MSGRASGGPNSAKNQRKNQKLTLLDLRETYFPTASGTLVNVEDASDAEFDAFIRQHIQVGWSLEERRDALNLALEQGTTLGLMGETVTEIKEKSG